MISLKRGVSPVIATTLLIAIVITLAGIVFIWAAGFVEEGLHKRGEPIERSCEALNFEADVFGSAATGYTLEINNRAEIPIYGFDIRALGQGTTLVSSLPPSPVEPGSSLNVPLTSVDLQGATEVMVIPILLGQKGDAGNEPFTCPDASGIGVTLH